MKRIWIAVAVLAFFGVHIYYTVQRGERQHLVRIGDGSVVSFAEVLQELLAADLIFIGELHDQLSHRRAQLQVIRALHEAGRPVAIGVEMFRADRQESLDQWVAGELSLAEFLPVYYDNWNFPWTFYRPLFEYARAEGIPMVGLNITQDVIRRVARGGFGSLSAEDVGSLPPIRCEIDDTYEAFIRRALGMHGHGGRTFVNFCEAQLVWDTVMAINLLDFLATNPQRTAVVVAGSGHAWRRGIPDQVTRRAPDLRTTVIVPEIPERLEVGQVGLGDADFLWRGLPLE